MESTTFSDVTDLLPGDSFTGSVDAFTPQFNSTQSYNVSTTTAYSGGIKPAPDEEGDTFFMWLPVMFVIIFSVIVICLIIASRFEFRCCRCDTYRRNSSEIPRLPQTNTNAGFTPGEETVPETPPPSYTSIARQTSCTSHISQSSTQLEIPPTYQEALALQEASTTSSLSSVVTSPSKPSSLRSRFRIFSRSLSMGDSRPSSAPSFTSNSDPPGQRMDIIASRETLDTIIAVPDHENTTASTPATMDDTQTGTTDIEPSTTTTADLNEITILQPTQGHADIDYHAGSVV